MVTVGHTAFAKLWPRARASLIDGIVAAMPSVQNKFAINTPNRLGFWLAQMSHECGGGTITEENLNYTALRMTQVWPTRFRTIASAQPFARNPKALANKVYNGRMGNQIGTDDGWNYRGRGLIQITGKDGYEQVGRVAGLNLVGSPDLANGRDTCLLVAGAFWAWKGLNKSADQGNFLLNTKLVNGGTTGYADRQVWLKRWMPMLVTVEQGKLL